MQSAVLIIYLAFIAFLIYCAFELNKSPVRQTLPAIPRRYVIAGLVGIIALSLYLRIYFPWANVFDGGEIYFLETDAYWHMDAVNAILADIGNTPVLQIVHRELVGSRALDLGIAFVSLIVGAEWVNYVGVLVPPLLNVLTLVVFYLLGRELFNQYIGLSAALFLAIIPSEYLHRSLLGFVDHHVTEVLLVGALLLAVVKLVKSQSAKGRVFYSIMAGKALYLTTVNWYGGLVWVVLILVWWTLVAFRNGVKARGLVIYATGILATAALFSLPVAGYRLYLLAVTPLPLLIYGLSAMWRAGLKWQAASAACLPSILLAVPERAKWLAGEAVGSFGYNPWSVINEAQPLFIVNQQFTPQVAWANFQWLFYLFIIGLVLLTIRAIKSHDDGLLLFALWSLMTLGMVFAQRRYAYYFSASLALLSAYALYETVTRLKVRQYAVPAFLALAFVFAIPFYRPALQIASTAPTRISPDWVASLRWVSDNSTGGMVTAWGDAGHWIRYYTDEQPNNTPGANQPTVARLFLSTNDTAQEIATQLDTGYFVVDDLTMTSKLPAVVTVAGYKASDFFGTYWYYDKQNRLRPATLLYPRYYQSVGARLLFYGGQPVSPPEVPVYFYEIKGGKRVVTGFRKYPSLSEAYEATERYTAVIASEYPDYPPVPLPPVPDFSLVFTTPTVKVAQYHPLQNKG